MPIFSLISVMHVSSSFGGRSQNKTFCFRVLRLRELKTISLKCNTLKRQVLLSDHQGDCIKHSHCTKYIFSFIVKDYIIEGTIEYRRLQALKNETIKQLNHLSFRPAK